MSVGRIFSLYVIKINCGATRAPVIFNVGNTPMVSVRFHYPE